MRYAFWYFWADETGYFHGADEALTSQGFESYAGWCFGEPTNNAKILGYFKGEGNPTGLEKYNFEEITQEQAITYCLEYLPDIEVNQSGELVIPEINAG